MSVQSVSTSIGVSGVRGAVKLLGAATEPEVDVGPHEAAVTKALSSDPPI